MYFDTACSIKRCQFKSMPACLFLIIRDVRSISPNGRNGFPLATQLSPSYLFGGRFWIELSIRLVKLNRPKPCNSSCATSNKIIQKGLAILREWSGSVGYSGPGLRPLEFAPPA